MSSSPSDPLSTHWSRIDALYGPDPEAAWSWFVERYRPFVREVLTAVLPPTTDVSAADTEFWGYFYLSRVVDRADRQRRFRALLFGTVRNFARRWREAWEAGCAPTVVLEATNAAALSRPFATPAAPARKQYAAVFWVWPVFSWPNTAPVGLVDRTVVSLAWSIAP
jgi:hypothetical protein